MLLSKLFSDAESCKIDHRVNGACYKFHEVVKKNWATAVRRVTRKSVTKSATLALEIGRGHSFVSCEAAVYRRYGDQHMVEYHMELTTHSLHVKVTLLRAAKPGARRTLMFERFDGEWRVARKSTSIVVPPESTLTEAAALAEAALLPLLPRTCV